MSTLWTPDGERPVGRQPEPAPASPVPPAPASEAPDPADADLRAEVAELEQQLLAAPAEVVVANHAYNLFDLAALHLSQRPPQLAQARIAIDAYGALVEGMAGRLGDAGPALTDGLAQLRMAFVQLSGDANGA